MTNALNNQTKKAFNIAMRAFLDASQAFKREHSILFGDPFKIERAELADRIEIRKTKFGESDMLCVYVFDEDDPIAYRVNAFIKNPTSCERLLVVNDKVEAISEIIKDQSLISLFDEFLKDYPDNFEVTLQY